MVAPHTHAVSDDELLAAGQLWAGARAVLTGRHALARQGLSVIGGLGPAVFLVPASSRSSSQTQARTVRTTRSVLVARRWGCVRLAAAALQAALTVPVRVDRELWASRPNRLGPVREGLRTFCDGAWSKPEATLQRPVRTSGVLPEMLMNRVLRDPSGRYLGRLDGYFREAALAVQVHSRQFHSGRAEDGTDRWAATVEKDSAMTAAGVVVVPVTPASLSRQPRGFLGRLEETFLHHRGRQLPRIEVADR